MKCPYCAENIKDEAIACSNCRRDLIFFKPIEQRLQAFHSELAAVTECVLKMAVFLDNQRDDTDKDIKSESGAVKKPRFKLMTALVVLLESFLSIGSLIGLIFLELSSRIKLPFDSFLFVFVPIFALSPIVLGLWIGVRWRGRNLKRYLIVGVLAGLTEGIALLIFSIVGGDGTPQDNGIVLMGAVVILARCIFGFVTGGLLGDVIERRKHPERYGNGFADSLALKLSSSGRDRVGTFDRMTKAFGSFTSAMAPILPLIGVIITSIVGYYMAIKVKK